MTAHSPINRTPPNSLFSLPAHMTKAMSTPTDPVWLNRTIPPNHQVEEISTKTAMELEMGDPILTLRMIPEVSYVNQWRSNDCGAMGMRRDRFVRRGEASCYRKDTYIIRTRCCYVLNLYYLCIYWIKFYFHGSVVSLLDIDCCESEKTEGLRQR